LWVVVNWEWLDSADVKSRRVLELEESGEWRTEDEEQDEELARGWDGVEVHRDGLLQF